MPSLFPTGALELNPSHSLAAKMLAGYVPRSGGVMRELVTAADLTVQGSNDYGYDSDGYMVGGGGAAREFVHSLTNIVNFAAARSFVVVCKLDDANVGSGSNYWMRAQAGVVPKLRLQIPEVQGSGRVLDLLNFEAATYAQFAGPVGRGGAGASDQIAIMVAHNTLPSQRTRRIVNQTAIASDISGTQAVTSGAISSIIIGTFPAGAAFRCGFVFDDVLTDAEFTALVADLGSTARVVSGGGDTTPPTTNGDPVIGARTSTTIAVAWPAGADNVGVTAAQISQDGGTGWINASSTTGHTLTGLTPSTVYPIRYRLRDAAGNTSAPSASVNGTTLASSPPLFGRGTLVAGTTPAGSLPTSTTVFQAWFIPDWPGRAGAPASLTATRVALSVTAAGAFEFTAPAGFGVDQIYSLIVGEWDGVWPATGDVCAIAGRLAT